MVGDFHIVRDEQGACAPCVENRKPEYVFVLKNNEAGSRVLGV